MELSLIDTMGFVASGLTLATFAQRSMLPMRVIAIAANICFIAYGAGGAYLPVFLLHVVLLPLNVLRLRAVLAERSRTCADEPYGAPGPGEARSSAGLI